MDGSDWLQGGQLEKESDPESEGSCVCVSVKGTWGGGHKERMAGKGRGGGGHK